MKRTLRVRRKEKRNNYMRRKFIPLILCIILLLPGCNLPQQVEVPSAATEIPAEAETEVPEIPTEIPTPLPDPEKVTWVTSEDDPVIHEHLTKALETICAERFECETVTSADAVPADTDFVIFAQEPQDIASLRGKFPEAGLIIVSTPGTRLDNVWTIQYNDAFLPFLAGFAVEECAQDWRGAGLLPPDGSGWGTHAQEAFLNGGHYMCGNCMPAAAPYVRASRCFIRKEPGPALMSGPPALRKPAAVSPTRSSSRMRPCRKRCCRIWLPRA